jgi:DNA-3-methyladenine glycosylase I
MNDAVIRCAWADGSPELAAYHDREWGVPSRDERHLFELLTLEGAQAGLSWLTILRKREGYRRAFAGFGAAAVARFGPRDVDRLLGDAGIVRHRGKIEATIGNARAVVALHEAGTTLAEVAWAAVGGEPRRNAPRSLADVPAETSASRALSRELKRLGFRFVGPTTVYAFMQAAGLVDDHLVECFRYAQLGIAADEEAVLIRLRTICLALPEVTERPSHGAPTFFVRGKRSFLMVLRNHHGDGRFAIWCAAEPGTQSLLVAADPERFFVPPYVGHRGWLGVRLDRGLDWDELAGIVEDAYAQVAPPALVERAAAGPRPPR